MTLYQEGYQHGVAALLNSALRQGFDGRVDLYHDAPALPPWTSQLVPNGQNSFLLDAIQIDFHRITPPRHLGYHKAYAARDSLNAHPDCDAVIYADPDVLFLAPWAFFSNWIPQGLAFCLDSHFPYLPSSHPWRETWRQLLYDATGLPARRLSVYPNSGFFGLTRDRMPFLDTWIALTEHYKKTGGDTSAFFQRARHAAIVGDQDLMAAALMGWDGPESIIGPDGMGFTGYFYLLSHDTGRPKAWARNFALEALAGISPSHSSSLFLDHCDGPIEVFSPAALRAKRISLRVAQVIARAWKR